MKILHVLSSLNIGSGIAGVLMNYINNINKSKFEIEILCYIKAEKSYEYILSANGFKVHYFSKPGVKNYFSVKKELDDFFINNKYDIVHCHDVPVANLILKAVKKINGTKYVIHSHNTKFSNGFIRGIRNKLVYKGVNGNADLRIACSKMAGDFQFKKYKYVIINNAINHDKYFFNEDNRKYYRKKLGVKDEILLGHVGRLSEQKNQLFLLKIMKELIGINVKYRLVLVGDGEDFKLIESSINNLGLKDFVILTGNIADVEKIYSAFDIFLFPSLFEGLGIAAIEAQFNGLTCLVSDKLPSEIKISEELVYLHFETNVWVNKILNTIEYRFVTLNTQADYFKSNYAAKQLEKLYLDLVNL